MIRDVAPRARIEKVHHGPDREMPVISGVGFRGLCQDHEDDTLTETPEVVPLTGLGERDAEAAPPLGR